MPFSRSILGVALVAASGCSVPIGVDRSIPDAGAATGPVVAIAPNCLLFGGPSASPTPQIDSPISVALPSGASVWLYGAAGAYEQLDFAAGATLGSCVEGARAIGATAAFEPASLPAHELFTMLSATTTSAGSSLFYEALTPDSTAAFGVRSLGRGVAILDDKTGQFVVGGAPLWTSDRPSYGVASVVVDDELYAFGCLDDGFLSADCYVARAPAAAVGDPAQYEYAIGGGRWSSNVEDAWPVVRDAGAQIDVAWIASLDRFVMVYATPLGTTLHVRSGLAPDGPWSEDYEIAACDLADSDLFCASIHAHPELTASDGALPVTYAIDSLSDDFAARTAADPAKYWPRLARLQLPTLP